MPDLEESYFLVLFEEVPNMDNLPVEPASPQGDVDQENTQLRQELDALIQEHTATQDYLQSVVQEHERINEELTIANQEILSSNEGLQSRNDELEIAKAEIQATNQELTVANQEILSSNDGLQSRNDKLEIAKAEIQATNQELTTANEGILSSNEGLQSRNDELEIAKAEIQATNKELTISNEGILSSNEGLQSRNDELEIAKAEIRATNEKLTIANSELRSRNAELVMLNNDLMNFFASVNIAILMLTNDLRVRKFTPMAQKLFNLMPADTQSNFNVIRTNFDIPNLEQIILDVKKTLHVKALEVQTTAGQCYMLTIRPYQTAENQIDGFVLVLHDIHSFRRSFAALEEARNYAEEIVESVPLPLLVLDSDLRVNKANQTFYQTFHQVEGLDTIQLSLFDLDNGQWNIPRLRPLLEGIFTNDTTVKNVEIEHEFERIGRKTMLLNAVKLSGSGDAYRLLLSIEDITERK